MVFSMGVAAPSCLQVCCSIQRERGVCDLSVHRQPSADWWEEVRPSTLCSGDNISTVKVLHVSTFQNYILYMCQLSAQEIIWCLTENMNSNKSV